MISPFGRNDKQDLVLKIKTLVFNKRLRFFYGHVPPGRAIRSNLLCLPIAIGTGTKGFPLLSLMRFSGIKVSKVKVVKNSC